ncbi:2-oxoacid:acceptor oxidoreductase family protein [Peptostreptococcus stomatis]|uniref:2-oxoacid:acceptor oxidoreductase family protein n=1 Tax=Peptostreptococcus stomatis TaxID=341694 RepID=UPI001355148E|nr:2-oxoacid:acceptor oxidoreductase family protein [Peptostreptococcus stomatis]EBU9957562.1 2-oxoacid:ferredoxin oxidoreductase subunit gamma [Salmonella enterica subsp. enterica serovar Tamberma]
MRTSRVICAGFGGQGVMSMGQLMTYAGMLENKEVSWLPSYGPEMRGGTANCAVTISDQPVGSPIITDDATAAVIMNSPSLTKFEGDVVPGGVILINSSLVHEKCSRDDIEAYYIDANTLSNELGGPKFANMVMLGAFLAVDDSVNIESVLEAFKKVFGKRKEKFIPVNRQALEAGYNAVMAQKK